MKKNTVIEFRTAGSSRQTHDVTKSSMERDRVIDGRDDSKTQALFLEILRENLGMIIQEYDESNEYLFSLQLPS